jgi:RNA polymerase sigma factor (sigma-70 family)
MTELVNESDARDFALAAGGNADAFARLYDRHAAVVLSLCRRATGGSIAEAEDAMQETFIRAHRRLGGLDDPAKFRPWLYAIVRNVCSERRRARGRRSRHEANAVMLNTARGIERLDGADAAAHAERMRGVTAALDRLEERERLVIHMHYLEADPVAAARSALGLSRSAYYKLLARAKRRLAQLLSERQPI